MNNQIKYIMNIAGVGVLIIVLLGIVFFWTDKLCDNAILDSVTANDYGIVIQPSGLMENEQQLIKEQGDKYFPSAVKASMNYNIAHTLGVFGDIVKEETRFQNLSMMSVAYDMMTDNVGSTIKTEVLKNSYPEKTYFDKNIGLFVNCHLSKRYNKWEKFIKYYIGPEGIDKKPTEQLGRFIEPFIDEMEPSPFHGVSIFYDKGLGRFFKINTNDAEKIITKGPELDSEKYNPVQIGYHIIRKPKYNVLSNRFNFPNDSKNTHQAADEKSRFISFKHSIVIHDNGRIDLLDIETLELKSVGHLPEYVKQQHSYSIQPIFFPNSHKDLNRYKGLIVSTISSNLRYMDTGVFDATGKKINNKGS